MKRRLSNFYYSDFFQTYKWQLIYGLVYGLLSLIIVVIIGAVSSAHPQQVVQDLKWNSFNISTPANASWILFGIYLLSFLGIYFYFKTDRANFKNKYAKYNTYNIYLGLKKAAATGIGMVLLIIAIVLGYYVYYYPYVLPLT